MTVTSTTSDPPTALVAAAAVRRPRKPRRWLRTRDREQLLQLNLQLDVNNLHSEIRALRVTRSLLQSRILNRHCDRDGSYVKMVHEYFSKLRHGYRYPQLSQHDQHQDQNDQEVMMISARHFLDVLFDPLVQKGHLRGVELCIQMIAKYTEAFGPVVHELVSAQIQADPHATTDTTESDGVVNHTLLVRAKTRYRTTIVPKTFEIIFPFAGQECREKLMHKTLEGTGQFDIVFDTTTHRVVRFDIQFDFVPAFARVESDPRILGQLFSRALVASDCCIGDKAKSQSKGAATTTSESPRTLRVETTVETNHSGADAASVAAGNTTPVKEEAVAATPSAPSPNSRYKVMDIRSLLNADTTE